MADISIGGMVDATSVADVPEVGRLEPSPNVADVISLSDYPELYTYANHSSTSVANSKYVEAKLSSENFFTESVVPMKKKSSEGFLNISIAGTFLL